MHKIDFTKSLEKLKNRREEKDRKGLRYKTFIASVVKEILDVKNPKLTNRSIDEISLLVYKKNDRITTSRVKAMLKQDVVKTDVNNELQRILTERNIKPIEKSIDLLQKGETLIKTTSDCIAVSDRYAKLANLDPVKATETREYSDFSAYKDAKEKGVEPTPDRITQRITVTGAISSTDIPQNDEISRENTSATPENELKTQEST